MSKKARAISSTKSKVIINMDVASEALTKTQLKNLDAIIKRLSGYDDRARGDALLERIANLDRPLKYQETITVERVTKGNKK